MTDHPTPREKIRGLFQAWVSKFAKVNGELVPVTLKGLLVLTERRWRETPEHAAKDLLQMTLMSLQRYLESAAERFLPALLLADEAGTNRFFLKLYMKRLTREKIGLIRHNGRHEMPISLDAGSMEVRDSNSLYRDYFFGVRDSREFAYTTEEILQWVATREPLQREIISVEIEHEDNRLSVRVLTIYVNEARLRVGELPVTESQIRYARQLLEEAARQKFGVSL